MCDGAKKGEQHARGSETKAETPESRCSTSPSKCAENEGGGRTAEKKRRRREKTKERLGPRTLRKSGTPRHDEERGGEGKGERNRRNILLFSLVLPARSKHTEVSMILTRGLRLLFMRTQRGIHHVLLFPRPVLLREFSSSTPTLAAILSPPPPLRWFSSPPAAGRERSGFSVPLSSPHLSRGALSRPIAAPHPPPARATPVLATLPVLGARGRIRSF